MILKIYMLVSIIFFSCTDKMDSNNIISNDTGDDFDYRVNLGWDESIEKSKTKINIRWDRSSDTANFIKYEVKDVSTDDVKILANISEIDQTAYQYTSPSGTFYKFVVVTHIEGSLTPSDTVQFFTQPLSSISGMSIDAQALQNTINWTPSSDIEVNKINLYRVKILSDYIIGETYSYNAPTLESLLLSQNGELENSEIIYNSQQIGEWTQIFEGDNSYSSYIDDEEIESFYSRYYMISVEVESDESQVLDFRYSKIMPENLSLNTLTIDDPYIILIATTDLKKKIKLTWDSYQGGDFYSYEIWRSDENSDNADSLESNGEKIVEITTRSQNSFEDTSLIGSEKSYYYFIRVNNIYGDYLNSNIIEGDTIL